MDKTQIKTTKKVYPQIYAYILPEIERKRGWIKIGYTEKKNVDERIQQQTKTADVRYEKLWSAPAKFNYKNQWFRDEQYHAYLEKYKDVERQKKHEWFYYDGKPMKSWTDYEDYINGDVSQVKEQLQYQLREEQQAAVEKTLKYVKNNPHGEFLWNAKPRFGKTLTTYDLARKLDAKTVLVVTNRPAIATSWFDDFEKFIAWQTEYKFISETSSLKKRATITREQYNESLGDREGYQITFVSLQDLKGARNFGGSYKKLDWIADLKWDMLVIDESHEGVETLKTDIAFDNIKRNFTLYLSGTPFKALAAGKFSDEQIYNWTYADEQKAKKQWGNIEKSNPYANLPCLNLFSYQMSKMVTDQVNQGAQIDGKNIDYAFDLNEFFATKDNGKFIHEEQVKKWLDTLTKNEKYPFSTPKLRTELKHTFWILDRVASAKALQKLLKEHEVFKEYRVVLAAGDGKLTDDQQVNEDALTRVRKAIKSYPKTITLSVGQLTTGVTVPEWTGVLMLSNMKSPSLYMQAAFRAQNAWRYEENGVVKRKENAYVFDFSPERTLIIYDEFANNLSNRTMGIGSLEERKKSLAQLLNFFPVIAEDETGKMKELNVEQVLTIPKTLKANEVVRRGFMSNLLFQNISGIFSSPEARKILEDLNPVPKNKSVPQNSREKIDTKDIEVDELGEVKIDKNIIVGKTEAYFGKKVYRKMQEELDDPAKDDMQKLASQVFKEQILDGAKTLAKEQGLTARQAENITNMEAKEVAREVERIQRNTNIRKSKLEREYERKKVEAKRDKIALEKVEYEYAQIFEDEKKQVAEQVNETLQKYTQATTERIVKKSNEKDKRVVEDDIRSRLRGFARTIPSFLMAYGTETTTLANFDSNISGQVFQEVTGITIEQFKKLRDKYQFFDEIVFNESIQTFLAKRKELANYFDETLEEDIFSYIPPQKTNQIFTPKDTVKLMVDKLENEDPMIFTDPTKTFADLYMKSGLYITEIAKRLYVGLEDVIPDPQKRIKHILEKQVYGFAPTEIIYKIAHNYIFGFAKEDRWIDDSHIVYLDTTPFAQGKTRVTLEEKCDELFGGKCKDEI
ncbi:DEAD/DEAH box helicase family protein [Ligilactobacillus murinus]|uniref:DEAD/DEAH box helicase family protein n=1 Tax=Ligilactobacillus murinus TaxID=1622 RepID=UPI00296AA173|nr:DEAD/DEAH box helicase family protein [Ligilactobacillus murinus]WOY88452.1 DEAD/DEAH box helicase family protein [Ligilactobacillus murinus]